MAGTAAVDAAVLLRLEGAGEYRCDEGALEGFDGWGNGWGKTCCLSEHVDEFEDENAGECSAQVGDAGGDMLAIIRIICWGGKGGDRLGLTLRGASCMFRQWPGRRCGRGRLRWRRT